MNNKQAISREDKIDILVEAACCIVANNKRFDGTIMFDVDMHFSSWVKAYVKERLKQLYK